jgi:hypothetical protein
MVRSSTPSPSVKASVTITLHARLLSGSIVMERLATSTSDAGKLVAFPSPTLMPMVNFRTRVLAQAHARRATAQLVKHGLVTEIPISSVVMRAGLLVGLLLA